MEYEEFKFPRGAGNILSTKKYSQGEMAIDTTNDELILFNGSTVGGVRLAKKSDLLQLTQEVKNLAIALETLTNKLSTYYDGTKPAYLTIPENTEA